MNLNFFRLIRSQRWIGRNSWIRSRKLHLNIPEESSLPKGKNMLFETHLICWFFGIRVNGTEIQTLITSGSVYSRIEVFGSRWYVLYFSYFDYSNHLRNGWMRLGYQSCTRISTVNGNRLLSFSIDFLSYYRMWIHFLNLEPFFSTQFCKKGKTVIKFW
jgi:hypothetical protein